MHSGWLQSSRYRNLGSFSQELTQRLATIAPDANIIEAGVFPTAVLILAVANRNLEVKHLVLTCITQAANIRHVAS